ncbi:ABATE domain-containing protein [Amycolatopsis rhabdoformis]|uniref:ABATE domain-containing protein n=1 Tax=Amycolatopsis rhabdoformis TaxID=1448059 RepID=A0ABZ1IDY5_9PSEU|nr:ABATE domain-containing protein [Amycolatopsis rhabdoformis]WSE32660.1 ABATE domain-containing protein [Amycolatopsis rhabdoformis]
MTTAVLLGEPLVVELMNTVNAGRDGVTDALTDDADVASWLAAIAPRLEREAGLVLDGDPGPVAERLRTLRDALRVLAAEATDDPRPVAVDVARSEALATLNELAHTRAELVWPENGEPARVLRSPGAPAERALAFLAHQGIDLFGGEQRHRLRACLAPNCLLFFVKDHSRREWCSAGCGNRARVQRHYQRHHGKN